MMMMKTAQQVKKTIKKIGLSTNAVDEKMLTNNITNWVEKQKKLKWRQAVRIVTQSPDRWTRKVAEWNRVLIISTKTQRRAGIPVRRWEDDWNDFVQDEETEATQSNDLKINNTWILLRRTSTTGKRKKDNTPNTLSTIEEPDTTTSSNTTSPATPRRRPSARFSSWSTIRRTRYTNVYELWTTCDEWHTYKRSIFVYDFWFFFKSLIQICTQKNASSIQFMILYVTFFQLCEKYRD